MRPSSIFAFLFLALLLFAVRDGTASRRGDDRSWLVDGACKLVSIFDSRIPKEYCISTLRGAPFDDKTKRSLRGLAWIAMNQLKANVSATKVEMERMVQSGNVEPFVKDGLADCISMYDEAADRVEDGLRLFEEKKYSEADRKVVMIEGDGYECNAWFDQKPGTVSPFRMQNQDAQWLSSMTVIIIRMFDRTYNMWGLAHN